MKNKSIPIILFFCSVLACLLLEKEITAEEFPPSHSMDAAAASTTATVQSKREGDGCKIGGCNGELCSETDETLETICLWQASHACYKLTMCEKQADGQCGWTQTPELLECLPTRTSTQTPVTQTK